MQLIGGSLAFLNAVAKLPAAIQADSPVLISGATGTGKELVAHGIHHHSKRSSRPFVAVNCGSLVDTLLEDQLFGHERGAFTDAHVSNPGLILQAEGGTLFLDEVDALTPRAQVALLRVLQDKTVRPLGSSQIRQADVRFIAATNAPLRSLMQAGAFRPDLYYRLSVFVIDLPPLRERKEDILPLASHFIQKHTPEGGTLPSLSSTAVAGLLFFDWPGNVRELENAVLRAVHSCRNGVIEVEDLGLPGESGEASRAGTFKEQKQRVIEAFERDYLVRLMIQHRGNVTLAARAASKERRDFGKLLKKYALDRQSFVGAASDWETVAR